jgi:hypothetical protein
MVRIGRACACNELKTPNEMKKNRKTDARRKIIEFRIGLTVDQRSLLRLVAVNARLY